MSDPSEDPKTEADAQEPEESQGQQEEQIQDKGVAATEVAPLVAAALHARGTVHASVLSPFVPRTT